MKTSAQIFQELYDEHKTTFDIKSKETIFCDGYLAGYIQGLKAGREIMQPLIKEAIEIVQNPDEIPSFVFDN